MFDKLYKEANDDIPVNVELLESLKLEALNGKRKNPYSFMYKYGFAAAAILIVIVSLNVLPRITKNQVKTEQMPGTNAQVRLDDAVNKNHETSENSTKEKEIELEENGMPNEEQNELLVNGSEEKITNDSAKKTNNNSNVAVKSNNKKQNANIEKQKTKTTEKNTKSAKETVPEKKNNAVSETKSKKTESTEVKEGKAEKTAEKVNAQESSESLVKEEIVPQAESMVSSEDNESTENISNDVGTANERQRNVSGGGGAGGGSSLYALHDVEIDSVENQNKSAEFENWKVPEGMKITNNDDYRVVYSGNGKSTYINLADSDYVSAFINEEQGEKYNGSLISGSEDHYKVYVVKNGKGYIIETKNLRKQEVYNLIDSIG